MTTLRWTHASISQHFYQIQSVSQKHRSCLSAEIQSLKLPCPTFGVFVPTRADHEAPSQLHSWTQAPELAEAASLRSHEGSEIVFEQILFPPNQIQFVSTEQCITSYLA